MTKLFYCYLQQNETTELQETQLNLPALLTSVNENLLGLSDMWNALRAAS